MSGVQVGWGGGGGGVGKWGDECSVNVGDFSYLFLKTFTEGAVTTEVASLFHYFITLAENADPPLRRWLAPWGTS